MNKFKYNLLSNAFDKKDIDEGIKVLNSQQITIGKITKKFENFFAKKIGSKYALMTNSGSSANLMALSALTSPLSEKKIPTKGEVLLPAVCWSTSLWPIIQNNLKPIFVDVELDTFNIDLDQLEKKISKNTVAIMLVHVLGISTNMKKLKKIIRKHKIELIEDTCESLGAKFDNKNLGTFGRFGTYSFYYSHQITSGEGGMITCDSIEDYNILKSVRSHGWSRDTIFQSKFSKKYPQINNNFLFIGPGYNLRPTEIQGAIAFNQFKKLDKFIKLRKKNRSLIIDALKKHKLWNNQFDFVKIEKNIDPSWFGLPFLINKDLMVNKSKFLKYLTINGIENRPIISGNFLNQPAAKFYNFKYNPNDFINSNEIEKRGFFIGLHTKLINQKELRKLVNHLLIIGNLN